MSINVMPMNKQSFNKIVCEIELSVLTDANVDHPDEAIRTKAQRFISAAYTLRGEIAEFALQLEADSLHALTAKHQELLSRRDEILEAQRGLVTDRGMIDNSKRREDESVGKAAFALRLHNGSKPDPKFTRAEKIAEWERERERMEEVLSAAQEKRVDVYGYFNAIQWDSTKLDKELTAIDGEIENTWTRILTIRGEAPQAPARSAPQVGLAG